MKFGSELLGKGRRARDLFAFYFVCFLLLFTLFAFYCFLRCLLSPVCFFFVALAGSFPKKKRNTTETIDLDLNNTLHFTNGIHAVFTRFASFAALTARRCGTKERQENNERPRETGIRLTPPPQDFPLPPSKMRIILRPPCLPTPKPRWPLSLHLLPPVALTSFNRPSPDCTQFLGGR